jgi:hypothetical protein
VSTFQRIIKNLSAAAALMKKTVLIASENVRKSRKFHEKMGKTQKKKKTRGKSLKCGKKRRKCEKKKRFRDLPARKQYY